MNSRALLKVVAGLAGSLALTWTGCSTTTPIGFVDEDADPPSSGSTGAAGATVGPVDAAVAVDTPPRTTMVGDPIPTNPTVASDWVGYLENYEHYFTGADAIRLHFGVDAAGAVTLTVKRGTGTPPAPPTDPFQAWPGPIYSEQGGMVAGATYPNVPMDGFVYTARDMVREGARLKFRTIDAEPWNTWCGLQTTYPRSIADAGAGLAGVIYTCDPDSVLLIDQQSGCQWAGMPDVRCTRNHLGLCESLLFCSCNASGCGASTYFTSAFDVTFLSDHAVGSMAPLGEGPPKSYSLVLTPVAAP